MKIVDWLNNRINDAVETIVALLNRLQRVVRSRAQAPGIKLGTGKKTKKSSKEFASKLAANDGLGFSYEPEKQDDGAYRITIHGLRAYYKPLGGIVPVKEISTDEIVFIYKKKRIKGGSVLKVGLAIDKQVVAKQVPCKVMEHTKGEVICQFVDLNRPQEDAIFKTVLRGQREQADRRKGIK